MTVACSLARAGDDPRPGVASISASDGQRWTGRITGDSKTGFRFVAEKGDPSIPLDRTGLITFEGSDPRDGRGAPPFQIELGYQQWVSGRLSAVEDRVIRLEEGPGGQPLVATRAGVLSLRQRPGEALVLLEGFENWDDSRWVRTGEPSFDAALKRGGARSLKLPATASSLSCRLPNPVVAGRFEVAFHHPGKHAEGRRWYAETSFRGPSGSTIPIRAVLGFANDTPSVETPEGPALAVQRLLLGAGWHTLSVQFDPERIELAIDGNTLAHGKEVKGALAEVRFVSEGTGLEAVAEDLATHLDELKLVRHVTPPKSQGVDLQQDEARMITGDQFFGTLRSADQQGIALEVDGRPVKLGWPEVASLRFRRGTSPGAVTEGQQVRVEWTSGSSRELDRVEGVLVTVTDQSLRVHTPYAGTLDIPTHRLKSLRPLGRRLRLVLDPTPHHLGDQYLESFDPPQAEGGVLEFSFTLDPVPQGPAALVLDVIEVSGEADNLPYADFIRNKELRTNVLINGQQFDYLNRHIADQNEAVERIRLPIPADALRPGANRLRVEQTGKVKEPTFLDDLGILGVALEFETDLGKTP